MVLEVLERIIKRPRESTSPPSEQKSLSEILEEIGEARKNGSPVLADYQIDWKRVAIGVTSEHLKKLEPTIRELAKTMQFYNLGILILVEKESLHTKILPENVRVSATGDYTTNWLRDYYFPIERGLIEKPGRRLSSELTPFITSNVVGLQVERYCGISFLRGGDAMVGENVIFIGGITWNYLVSNLGIEKAKGFLNAFFGKEKVIVVPWELIHEEDVPIPCTDLDSYLTVLGEKTVIVGQEVNSQNCPNTFKFLEDTAEMLRENGFRVLRLPFVGREQRTYNNSLIHGPKKLAFIPKYGEKDELYFRAAEVYQQVGYTPIGIPFLTSFSRSNFGQIRCLSLPLPL
jgi:hypothetical protein